MRFASGYALLLKMRSTHKEEVRPKLFLVLSDDDAEVMCLMYRGVTIDLYRINGRDTQMDDRSHH